MASEKRLIDANALLDRLERLVDLCNPRGYVFSVNGIADEIGKAPTADAVEVVHGRWLKTKEPLGWHEVDCCECSNCHESWVFDEEYGFEDLCYWKYCPNCGAKMDGGDEDV